MRIIEKFDSFILEQSAEEKGKKKEDVAAAEAKIMEIDKKISEIDLAIANVKKQRKRRIS